LKKKTDKFPTLL